MKHLLLSFILIFSVVSLFAQSKKEIKSNKIKSSTEVHIIAGHEKDSTYKDTYQAFDKDGNTIEEIKFNPNGTVKKRRTFKFDSDKNKTEEVEYDGTTLSKKHQYSYNAHGDKVLEVTYDGSNKLVKKEVYIYNSLGLKVEHKIYDGNNVLIETHKFTYDTGKGSN